MKPPMIVHRAFRPTLRDTDLPAGIIGQIGGIALVYDELDSHNSVFAKGSLERTAREKVAAGKVKLFWDHGDMPMNGGMYDTDLHIGIVRSLTDVQLDDGRWAAWMVADLFDTPEAHKAKNYVERVLQNGGETGLSVGGRAAGIKSTMVRMNGDMVERITEFPLQEISITAEQAVPDSEVLAVRAETESPVVEDAQGLSDAIADGTVIATAVLDDEPEVRYSPDQPRDPAGSPTGGGVDIR